MIVDYPPTPSLLLPQGKLTRDDTVQIIDRQILGIGVRLSVGG